MCATEATRTNAKLNTADETSYSDTRNTKSGFVVVQRMGPFILNGGLEAKNNRIA